jgi:hypothetical protein
MQMTCKMPDHARVVDAMLDGFVQACEVIIASGLAPPDPLDVPGIRYQLEPPGSEDWKLPMNVIRDGWGDCEDLAGWRAAGLRVTGRDPGARCIVVKTGDHKLHAVTMLSDGSISDPSRDLYMRQRDTVVGATRTRSHRGWFAPRKGDAFAGLPPAAAPSEPGGDTGWEATRQRRQAASARARAAGSELKHDRQEFSSPEEAAQAGIKWDRDSGVATRMTQEERDVYDEQGFDPSGRYRADQGVDVDDVDDVDVDVDVDDVDDDGGE